MCERRTVFRRLDAGVGCFAAQRFRRSIPFGEGGKALLAQIRGRSCLSISSGISFGNFKSCAQRKFDAWYVMAVVAARWRSAAAHAIGYPENLRIVVPTAPGGAADTIARMLAQHLSNKLGQQFYVENKPGAGNIIGIETVAHSPGDGYTLLVGAATITLSHVVHKKLPYDVARDFTPITQLVSCPMQVCKIQDRTPVKY